MQAVILSAGMGTRMGEWTKDIPKPLLKVSNETILEHDLKALPDEIDEAVIVIGYLGEKIRKAVGNILYPLPYPPHKGEGKEERISSPLMGEGRERVIKINYVEQKELKGTGHALFACKDILKGRFLVLHGDDLYAREDFAEMVKRPLAILVSELREDDLKSGYQAPVKIGENGEVVDIIERQPAKKGMLVNTGCYVLNEKIFEYPLVSAGIPADEFGLPQTMLQMVRDGAKFDIVKARWWHKVASPQDLSSPDLDRGSLN